MTAKSLIFFLNGEKVEIRNIEPNTTLLQYLRSPDVGLTGTKDSCGSGVCGACTVLMMFYDYNKNKPYITAVKACNYPLMYCHGRAIFTIEKSNHPMEAKLNAVQEAFVKHEGTQCGYCLPGTVMSTMALFQKHQLEGIDAPTVGDIEEVLSGHTCRCTGYRPIFESLKEFFTKEGTKAPQFEIAEFPEELVEAGRGSFAMEGALWEFYEPKTLEELRGVWKSHPDAILLGGATNSTQLFRDYLTKRTIISTAFVKEMQGMEVKDGYLHVGGAVPIQTILEFAREEVKECPSTANSLSTITEILPRLRTKEIRTVSTIAGELMSMSEITALLVSLGAIVKMEDSLGAATERTPLTGPCKCCQNPASVAYDATTCCVMECDQLGKQLITCVKIPLHSCQEKGHFSDAVLVSRRKDNFPALMLVVMKAHLELNSDGAWKFVDVSLTMSDGRGNSDRESTKPFRSTFPSSFPVETDPMSMATAHSPAPILAVKSRRPLCIIHRLPETAEHLVKSGRVTSETFVEAKEIMKKELHNIMLAGKSAESSTDEAYAAACAILTNARPPLPTSMLTKRYITLAAPDTLNRFAFDLSRHLGIDLKAIIPKAGDAVSTVGEGHLELEERQTRFRKTLPEYKFDFEQVDTLVGSSVGNIHIKSHAAGMTKYTADLSLPARGLYATFILSTIAHGKIVEINGKEALKLPGVVEIVTAKDITGINKHTGIVMDTQIFADGEVLCMHQPLGLVLATTPHMADYAATLVKVEYEELPAILTIEEAMEKKSFLSMYAGKDVALGEPVEVINEARAVQQRREEKRAKGEPVSEEEDEWVVFSGEAKCGGQDHYYAETQNCVVIPHEDMMEVYSSTQNPSKVQFDVAGALGIPRAKVTCRAMRLGGGFGGKQDRPCILATAAAVAAKKTGRAIRLRMNRTVDMAVHGGRHPMWMRYTGVISKKTGKIKALDAEVIAHGGYAHDVTGPVLFKTIFQLQSIYTIPHIRTTARAVKTHHNPNTAFRGFGAPQSCLFIELVMEHASDLIGMPALAIRDVNMNKVGDELMTGSLVSEKKGERFIRSMWDELVKTSNYEERLKAVEEYNATHTNTKRGIAITPMKNGACFEDDFMNQAEALVHVLPDGSVEVSHSGIEMGQGLNTKIAQMAAETLGIDMKYIHVMYTSTETCANTQPTAASSGLDVNGGAVQKACSQIKANLAPYREKFPDKPWPEICTIAYFSRTNMSGQAHFVLPSINWQWDTKTGYTAFYYAFGVAVSEVEVDCGTGEFTILRSDLIEDAGRSFNPILDAGQVEGGFVQGIGWTTSEEIEYDIGTGAMLTDMHTYAAPHSRDVPLELRTTLAKGFRNVANVGQSKTTAESPVLLGVSVFMALRHAVNAARADRGLSPLRYQLSPLTVDRAKLAIEGALDGEDGMTYSP